MKLYYPMLCYYPSQAGGPANTIFWLNRAMGQRGHFSKVVSTKYGLNDVPNADMYKNHNIDVEFVDLVPFGFFQRSFVRHVENCDLVHFSSIFFSPTLPLLWLALKNRKGVIVSPRGELYTAALARSNFKKRLFLRVFKFFQHKIVFHGTNDDEVTLIKAWFPKAKSVVMLPNYIELPVRAQIEKKKQIVFLGRINPIKNIDILISSYFSLPETLRDNLKLVIAGEAKLDHEKIYQEQLRRLVMNKGLENNVEFRGGVYHEAKDHLIAESLALILPSKSENFGNVVLEALSQGTPVVASRGTPWHVLDEYHAGFWVEPTEEGMKQALQTLLTMESADYEQLTENAIKLVSNMFDIKSNTHKWESLYSECSTNI